MIAPTEVTLGGRPLLILAYADSLYAVQACRYFRRLGWEVHLAYSGPEARRLARRFEPTAVVLDTELANESGWLTCDKLRRELPSRNVILVTPAATDERRELAAFVGASALVCRGGGINALAEELLEVALPAVG